MKKFIWCLLILTAVALLFITTHKKMPTKITILVEKLLSPGYSCCSSCGRPWKFIKHHDTWYTQSRACFPLCQNCWSKMTPQERLPFYYKLWASWGPNEHAKWSDIEAAVLAGK